MPDVDEGPSPEDLERFGGDTAYCPDCGEEIWDLAETCPKCHAYLDGGTDRRPPVESWFHNRWILLVVILTILAFALVYVF